MVSNLLKLPVSIEKKTYQSILVPYDTLLLVGIGVGVALDLAGLAAEEAVESRTSLAGTTLLDSVALLAASLEELSALCGVALTRYVSYR